MGFKQFDENKLNRDYYNKVGDYPGKKPSTTSVNMHSGGKDVTYIYDKGKGLYGLSKYSIKDLMQSRYQYKVRYKKIPKPDVMYRSKTPSEALLKGLGQEFSQEQIMKFNAVGMKPNQLVDEFTIYKNQIAQLLISLEKGKGVLWNERIVPLNNQMALMIALNQKMGKIATTDQLKQDNPIFMAYKQEKENQVQALSDIYYELNSIKIDAENRMAKLSETRQFKKPDDPWTAEEDTELRTITRKVMEPFYKEESTIKFAEFTEKGVTYKAGDGSVLFVLATNVPKGLVIPNVNIYNTPVSAPKFITYSKGGAYIAIAVAILYVGYKLGKWISGETKQDMYLVEKKEFDEVQKESARSLVETTAQFYKDRNITVMDVEKILLGSGCSASLVQSVSARLKELRGQQSTIKGLPMNLGSLSDITQDDIDFANGVKKQEQEIRDKKPPSPPPNDLGWITWILIGIGAFFVVKEFDLFGRVGSLTSLYKPKTERLESKLRTLRLKKAIAEEEGYI